MPEEIQHQAPKKNKLFGLPQEDGSLLVGKAGKQNGKNLYMWSMDLPGTYSPLQARKCTVAFNEYAPHSFRIPTEKEMRLIAQVLNKASVSPDVKASFDMAGRYLTAATHNELIAVPGYENFVAIKMSTASPVKCSANNDALQEDDGAKLRLVCLR